MLRRSLAIACALVALLVSPAFAAKDALLDHLAGSWVLTGTIGKEATTHDVKAEWVLNDQYLRLSEISREKDAAGKPQYAAEVLLAYDPAKKHYVCFWFDNTVVAATTDGGSATRDGDKLPFVFKSASGDFFNTMTYDAKAGSWTWAMDGEDKGVRQPFARLTLKRP
ncbi:hypothetical protein FHS83_003640 [Rhizomicrobium palustre]|uniref:DUF1579 domain-containing protein n=1 Tax=Rhizomicrobium palustre TaxID=189966 RepID=A0A846N562_9PROT|nr:DUF1579 family protein [Rhizomicrobium palustre]NIK90322.1 hypothetical protein [Rhizomicrobium palustre]